MALDDQLAALAAGELDEETARALRARAAADPALARRLARHEQLQQLLTEWEAPQMSDDAVQRLDARVSEALAELGDEPLAERTPAAAPLPAAPEREPARDAPGVVDLDRARRRRTAGGGGFAASGAGGNTISWPSWGVGAAVAAALLAVVGVGVVVGGLPGGGGLDMLAGGGDDSAAEEAADSAEVAEDDGGFSGATAESAPAEEQGLADDEEMAEQEAADADDSAASAAQPARRDAVTVAEGELLSLLDMPQDADEDGGDAAEDGAGRTCVDEALRRDTPQADDRDVTLLAEGTYAGRDAAFVVVRSQQQDGPDRIDVLAYDPDGCSLLARDETTG